MTAPPPWLAKMANQVASEMHAMDVLSPIGCHYYHSRDRNQWEVTLFASKTEVVGGQRDGLVSPSKFTVDVGGVIDLFTEVTALNWQALPVGPGDELGPHVSLEGVFQGHAVWLRILAKAPRRYKAGRRASVYEFHLEDIW